MKKRRSLEFKVGLLILVAAGILGAFVFALGSFSLAKGYHLYVDFNFAGNVQKGAPVKVSGIKVGKVQEIRFLGGALDATTGRRVQVRVVAWVEDRVREAIRDNAEFFVSTAGVLGEQYIEIVPGTYDHPPLGEGKIVVGIDPARTDIIIARLYELLDSATSIMRDDKDVIRDLLKNRDILTRDLAIGRNDRVHPAVGEAPDMAAGHAEIDTADFHIGHLFRLDDGVAHIFRDGGGVRNLALAQFL